VQVVVQEIRQVAAGIIQLTLRPVKPADLPTFTPGAHIDLHLPGGLIRQYSLLGSAPAGTLAVAVNLDPASRGGSAAVHRDLKAGDTITIDGPRNNFPLAEDAPHSVLIGGGIGITPLQSMACRLADLGRDWTLYHCARTPERTPFMGELRALATTAKATFVHVHDGVAGIAPLNIDAVVAAAPAGAHFYCCGPAPLMAAFAKATAGLPADRVHVEYFSNTAAKAPASGFEVVLARAGKTLTVPAEKSILETLEAAGLAPLCSCREGICGTCETTILAGEPDHRDVVLSPDERASNATMMICVSRAKSASLTLDI
jgi:ferredoxin-NADP reductase